MELGSSKHQRRIHMRRSLIIFAAALLIQFAIGVQTTTAQEDLGRLLQQLEDDSDRFSNTVAKALDKSSYDGTAAEDEMVRYVRDFEDAIDRLKNAYDNRGDRVTHGKAVQTRAKAIDKFLKKNSLGDTVATDWGTVRADLLRLARALNIKAS
jgi:hypothetical protein